MGGDNDNSVGGAAQSPHEYDFSSDFSISEVKDAEDAAAASGGPDPLPKSISEAVAKSLSQISKPGAAAAAPQAPAAPKPDPFREPINKLDTQWPFASPETIEKHAARESDPSVPKIPTAATAPVPPLQKQVPAPMNLPTGMAAPVAAAMPQVPPAPQQQPFVRPIPVTPPRAPLQQTPPPAVQTPSAAAPLKNIRTFEGDVAEALSHRPISRTSIAVAESKKRGEGETISNASPTVARPEAPYARVNPAAPIEEKSHIGRTITLIVLALVLLGAGIFGGYYLYQESPLAATRKPLPADTKPKIAPALVPYDRQAVVSIDNASGDDILARIRTEIGKPQNLDSVKEIVFTETKEGVIYRVSAAEMALLADVPVPDIIARTLQPEWMLGVYAAPSGEKSPFVVVHTNLFQNAFAGMLAWEPSMAEDLKRFLAIPAASSTPAGRFSDQIVRNKDVRAFVTDNDRTVIEYSFIDNGTLVVTTDNRALTAIISRLENKAFVR